jgi:hypothetical protein
MRRLMLAAVLMACGSKGPTDPFVRRHVDGIDTDPCVAWVNRAFVYRVDPALSAQTPGDHGLSAIEAAVQSWRDVAASCSDFTYTEDAGVDTQNLIVFREQDCTAAVAMTDPCFANGTCGDMYNCWDGDSMTLAVTTLTYSRSTGRIDKAEVKFDAAHFLFTNVDSPMCNANMQMTSCVASDIQNTLTHELGHAIGLDHTNAPGSTMAPTAPVGETSKRVIDDGTKMGFCTIYPKGMPTPSCLSP